MRHRLVKAWELWHHVDALRGLIEVTRAVLGLVGLVAITATLTGRIDASWPFLLIATLALTAAVVWYAQEALSHRRLAKELLSPRSESAPPSIPPNGGRWGVAVQSVGVWWVATAMYENGSVWGSPRCHDHFTAVWYRDLRSGEIREVKTPDMMSHGDRLGEFGEFYCHDGGGHGLGPHRAQNYEQAQHIANSLLLGEAIQRGYKL